MTKMKSSEKKPASKLLCLLSFAALLIPRPTTAQNPYLGSSSVGKVSKPAPEETKEGLRYRPLSAWVGERFILLPKARAMRRFGYQDIGHGFGHGLDYADHVGRIARVTQIENGGLPTVHFKFEDNGEEVYATAYTGTISDIAPVADIDSARARWLGKTLWYSGRKIDTYDEQEEQSGSVKLKRYSPVKVINIVAGWESLWPVRFIVQDSGGESGFVDVNLTGTNGASRTTGCFDKYFAEQNPRIAHPWDARTWGAIENGKVFEGMTEEQAEMSWGKPMNINQTVASGHATTQWVYGSRYLYFTDGVLTSIQN